MGSRIRKCQARGAVLAVAASATLTLAACGGSSGPTTPNNAVSRGLAFDQCLQSHGITLPTSSASAASVEAAEEKDPTKVLAAVRACASQLGTKISGLPGGL